MLKTISISVVLCLVAVATVYFVLISKRNKLINSLSATGIVSVRNFDSFSTAMLQSWNDHMKQIDKGNLVSFQAFTFNGKNYNITDGKEK